MSRKRRASSSSVIEYDALQDDDAYHHYLCPVCMDVAGAKPLELPCGHTFCTDCLTRHLKSFEEHDERACPVCRTTLPRGAEPKPASDLAERKSVRVRCVCGREQPLLQLRRHTDECPSLRGRGASAVQKAKEASQAKPAAPAAANRSTFACPFCGERNLPRAELLRHVTEAHADCNGVGGVCPVCAAMPWGDPNYRSPNLIQHMLLRHQFDYAETADYGRSEDDVLAEVLRQSITDR